jgi:hypothetical protein
MSIDVSWDEDDSSSILVFTFSPGFTWAEFEAALLRGHRAFQHAGLAATLVFDLQQIDRLPLGSALPYLKPVAARTRAQVKGIILIMGGKLAASYSELLFTNAIRAVYPRSCAVEMAFSWTQARRFVQSGRVTPVSANALT